MGKGRRKRKTANKHPEYTQLCRTVLRLERATRIVAVCTVVFTLLAVAFQALLQSIMYANLSGGVYEAKDNAADDIAALTSILPTGSIALVLFTIGVVLAAILLWHRKTLLSLIGCALTAIGIAFFIPYVYNLGLLFTYNEFVGVNNGVGLSTAVQFYQHYSALLPLLLLIPAEILSAIAAKKQTVLDVMVAASDTASTLSLGDEPLPENDA